MKRKLLLFGIMLFVVVLCLAMTACKKEEKLQDNLSYQMNLSLIEDTISGKEIVKYKNVYAKELGESVFHLYANAYSEGAQNPAYIKELSKYGGIEIKSVKVNGEKADFSLSEDKEYLTVSHKTIKKGKEIGFEIEFETKLPAGNLRLSHNENAYTLAGFYPQLSVYDGESFRKDKFSSIGDPMYSGVAKYDITFECDKNLVVCSSVRTGKIKTEGERQHISFNGENIRDFAIVCNSNFNVINKKVGDTEVYYFYTNDENAQETLALATKAIETFGNAFGKYPYDTYTLVRAGFNSDGMEYTGLSLIAENCSDLEETVLHETAHQWWYGIVGSDCINESFMDEGLATFSAAYFYNLIGDKERFNKEISEIKKAYSIYENLQRSRKTEVCLAMNKPIYDFTEYQYAMVQYYKSCAMFDAILELYGQEKFAKCLKKYCADNTFKIAGYKEFLQSAKQTIGDIHGITDGWIGEKVTTATFLGK